MVMHNACVTIDSDDEAAKENQNSLMQQLCCIPATAPAMLYASCTPCQLVAHCEKKEHQLEEVRRQVKLLQQKVRRLFLQIAIREENDKQREEDAMGPLVIWHKQGK
jgi:hypothetical protein